MFASYFLQDQESQRQSALDDFQSYKNNAERREIAIKEQHAKSMLELSQQVLKAKKDFEEKLRSIASLKDVYEADKLTALEELEAKHKSDLEKLLASQAENEGGFAAERLRIEQKYAEEINNLETNIERLEDDKKQIKDEYEGKLHKAQQFYENELEVLKNSQSLSYEEQMTVLQEKCEKLKRDLNHLEGESKRRADDLLTKLAVSEEEARSYQEQLNSLKDTLKNKHSDSEFLNKQVKT